MIEKGDPRVAEFFPQLVQLGYQAVYAGQAFCFRLHGACADHVFGVEVPGLLDKFFRLLHHFFKNLMTGAYLQPRFLHQPDPVPFGIHEKAAKLNGIVAGLFDAGER